MMLVGVYEAVPWRDEPLFDATWLRGWWFEPILAEVRKRVWVPPTPIARTIPWFVPADASCEERVAVLRARTYRWGDADVVIYAEPGDAWVEYTLAMLASFSHLMGFIEEALGR